MAGDPRRVRRPAASTTPRRTRRRGTRTDASPRCSRTRPGSSGSRSSTPPRPPSWPRSPSSRCESSSATSCSPDAWQDGTAEVTANDISAWVELDAGELGWVPVDVTPDRSRVPDPDSQGATTQEIAMPNPPPPPPPPPNVEPPRQRDDEPEDEPMEPIRFSIGDGRGLAPWAVVAVGRGRRAGRAAAAVRRRGHRVEGRCAAGAGAGARPRRPGSPVRGPRRSTGARRPARRG